MREVELILPSYFFSPGKFIQTTVTLGPVLLQLLQKINKTKTQHAYS